jgi:hypothetical protein
VDFGSGVQRSEFGHDEGEGGVLNLEGEGVRGGNRNSGFLGAPVGHASPPIRDGASLLPTPTSHKPSSPPGPHAVL